MSNQSQNEDLDQIPDYLRAGIQKIIEKRVAQRVDEEMKFFKDEIRAELMDQQAVNQSLMNGNRPSATAPPPGYGNFGGYGQPQPHYGAPPGDLRQSNYYPPGYKHVSPVRA